MNKTLMLRERLNSSRILVVPGAFDALSARIIERAGFSVVYATGAGYANAAHALPDVGLISSSEVTAHVARLTAAVDVPVIVDADTGYGGVLQVRRTVRELERAGAAAIQLEDQVVNKRCGHFEGHQLVSTDEMVQKIRIAVATRADPNLLIIARTDARSAEGFDAAVARARAFREAGADALFVEAPKTRDEVAALPRLLDAPLIANMVEGGKTPAFSATELEALGYKIALFANTALRASIAAVDNAMAILYQDGSSDRYLPHMATWDERQELVRLESYQRIEDEYSGEPSDAVPVGILAQRQASDGTEGRGKVRWNS